ncbi:MAG: hypothetical protein EOO09_20325, partial [Chitinophagaceae bacterium]
MLDRILALLEEGQHQLYIDDELAQIKESNWVKNLSASHSSIITEILEKSVVSTASIPKKVRNQKGVISIDIDNNEYSLTNALKYLDEPLYIVVENLTSDGAFIRRLFEIYRQVGGELKTALERNFLEFYPAGGKNEIIKTIKQLIARKSQPYTPRVIVFLDSDKRFPGQEDDYQLINIREFCVQFGIGLHVLYKREIENYLPDVVLRNCLLKEHDEILNEFCTMSPDQKDFYDLEKGFNNK